MSDWRWKPSRSAVSPALPPLPPVLLSPVPNLLPNVTLNTFFGF
ncbi:hypothetical protein [Dendronalium sp. ChiSLP03b]|nr:hypothetical protein [Dendronalium sp. ChiSLP03b]MDZ8209404.1 hypothetical protein [Dendronalium sp. ChiSLP03b]